jgi:hypothetical protein
MFDLFFFVALLLPQPGGGLQIVGPTEVEANDYVFYQVSGLPAELLPYARIDYYPRKDVQTIAGMGWGGGQPYVLFRAKIETTYQLEVTIDHPPLGSQHVPDEVTEIEITVGDDVDPPPPPPPSDLAEKVAKALEAVPQSARSRAGEFAARYRRGVEEAKANKWTAKQLQDRLKTELLAPPVTIEEMKAWSVFWPAMIMAFVQEDVDRDSLDELTEAYLTVADVLEAS